MAILCNYQKLYAANPYLMHFMEHINVDYLLWSRTSKISLRQLADMMASASFGSFWYDDYMKNLKNNAKKLGCAIEELQEQVDESVYDIEL